MNTQRARRAAATALLSAGALLLLPAAAHADTCMTDDKGNYVCGSSGAGPTSGPGAYSGSNGVHDGTVGAPGPDGRPLIGTSPQPWMAPGWTPQPGQAGSEPAPNNPGLLTAPPPGSVLPGDVKTGTVPPAQSGTRELPPPVAGGAGGGAAGSNPSATASASATASPSASASAKATPVPTMTAMATHAPPPTRTAEPAAVAESRASQTEPFNPVPLLAGFGGLAVAGAVAWFVPGIRSAITGLLHRGH